MADEVERCWICETNEATTGEHAIKHTDLRAIFGSDLSSGKFFIHTLERTNRLVQSLRSDHLKSKARLCESCNSKLTQPYDQAWTSISAWLRNRQQPFKINGYLRTNRVFSDFTTERMLDLHLYFVKLFGCRIRAEKSEIEIPLATFSSSLMQRKPHPGVYLQIGEGNGDVGWSALRRERFEAGHVRAIWFYRIREFTVCITYLDPAVAWENVATAWHPRFGTNRLRIKDFTGPKGELRENTAE